MRMGCTVSTRLNRTWSDQLGSPFNLYRLSWIYRKEYTECRIGSPRPLTCKRDLAPPPFSSGEGGGGTLACGRGGGGSQFGRRNRHSGTLGSRYSIIPLWNTGIGFFSGISKLHVWNMGCTRPDDDFNVDPHPRGKMIRMKGTMLFLISLMIWLAFWSASNISAASFLLYSKSKYVYEVRGFGPKWNST
jgi:hypothetical protein